MEVSKGIARGGTPVARGVLLAAVGALVFASSAGIGRLLSTEHAVFAGIDATRGSDERHLEIFSLRGRFFAAVEYGRRAKCEPGTLEVFDLRAARQVRTIAGTDASKILLGARGGVAIIERVGTRRRRIRVWDDRSVTLVARSQLHRKLRLGSVRVHGNLLRWTQAGAERSFRMQRSWLQVADRSDCRLHTRKQQR